MYEAEDDGLCVIKQLKEDSNLLAELVAAFPQLPGAPSLTKLAAYKDWMWIPDNMWHHMINTFHLFQVLTPNELLLSVKLLKNCHVFMIYIGGETEDEL